MPTSVPRKCLDVCAAVCHDTLGPNCPTTTDTHISATVTLTGDAVTLSQHTVKMPPSVAVPVNRSSCNKGPSSPRQARVSPSDSLARKQATTGKTQEGCGALIGSGNSGFIGNESSRGWGAAVSGWLGGGGRSGGEGERERNRKICHVFANTSRQHGPL